MNNYSDQEVTDFLFQQKTNYERTAKGSGFPAKEARQELLRLAAFTKEERLQLGRETLAKFNLKTA